MSTGTGQTLNNPALRNAFRDYVVMPVNFIPLAADADFFKTSTVLAAQTTTLLAASMTSAVAPNWPVVPIVVISNDRATADTAWTSVACTFNGVDQFGEVTVDVVAGVLSGAGVGTNTWTCTGNVAYCSLVSVVFVVTGGTAADGSDSYTIGYAKEYGLCQKIMDANDILVSTFNNAADAGTVNIRWSTYIPAGTPNATAPLALVVRSTAYDLG